MNPFDFMQFSFLDVIDILLVSIFTYYVYKLLKGTVAINIFIGIIVLFAIYKITSFLELKMFSNILGALLSVGVVGIMIVFQQEIRKFLLMVGSANFKTKNAFFRQLKFLKTETQTETDVESIVSVCFKMGKEHVGAIIVFERTNNLDFVMHTGDKMFAQANAPLIESIFYKNSPLHDGAIIIKNNIIKATRIVLPLSSKILPKRFGLRHKAAIGITEKTDAVCLVISEETGKISYISDGEFVMYDNEKDLIQKIKVDLS